jgi:hypothetical protein
MARFLPVFLSVFLLSADFLYAVNDLIDIPTTQVLNRYAMETNFRLYYNGGVISRISFGVFDRVNIGCSLDVDKLIGTQPPVIRPPSLNLKLRLYDGAQYMPALAIGYDGQGHSYANTGYTQREKGIYFVGDEEAFARNLEFIFGGNLNSPGNTNSDSAQFHCFVGATYTLQKNEQRLLCFMAECDNIFELNRLNCGVRIFPSPALNIDLSVTDMASSNAAVSAERLIKINYEGQF